MCVGHLVLSSICLRSVYLEELLENVTAALLFGFRSFGFKPFQRCCESNTRETAFTDAFTARCSFSFSLISPAAVPNILCKLYINVKDL